MIPSALLTRPSTRARLSKIRCCTRGWTDLGSVVKISSMNTSIPDLPTILSPVVLAFVFSIVVDRSMVMGADVPPSPPCSREGLGKVAVATVRFSFTSTRASSMIVFASAVASSNDGGDLFDVCGVRLCWTTRVVVLWTFEIGEPFAVVNGVVVVVTELALVEASSAIVMVVLAIGETVAVLAIVALASVGSSSVVSAISASLVGPRTPVSAVKADVCVLSFPPFTVMVVGRLFAMNSAYCFSMSLMPLLPDCNPWRI